MSELPSLNNHNKKTSINRKLTTIIDKVVENINTLDSTSPRVTREMTKTFRELGLMTENIKKKDLDPFAFQANENYRNAKDKIKAYIDHKYNNQGLKDSKRILEILQNRPLTTFYKPSTKLLFDSLDQHSLHEVISTNKRKFGEYWEVTPKSKTKSVELSPISKIIGPSPRNQMLSKLITKLMVKNLGIKASGKKDIDFSFKKQRYANKHIPPVKKTDEIHYMTEEEYLGPEYAEYISDISNTLKIQKYLSKGNGKRRMNERRYAKISKL